MLEERGYPALVPAKEESKNMPHDCKGLPLFNNYGGDDMPTRNRSNTPRRPR